jgi:hypothetical protein
VDFADARGNTQSLRFQKGAHRQDADATKGGLDPEALLPSPSRRLYGAGGLKSADFSGFTSPYRIYASRIAPA